VERPTDGPVVAGVCAVGDTGHGTWRGAELKASRGAGGLGKARPRAARGGNVEAAGCGRAGGAARTTSRRGHSRLENVSQYLCSNAKISKNLNRSARCGE
jgi:hypothetical protein